MFREGRLDAPIYDFWAGGRCVIYIEKLNGLGVDQLKSLLWSSGRGVIFHSASLYIKSVERCVVLLLNWVPGVTKWPRQRVYLARSHRLILLESVIGVTTFLHHVVAWLRNYTSTAWFACQLIWSIVLFKWFWSASCLASNCGRMSLRPFKSISTNWCDNSLHLDSCTVLLAVLHACMY